MEFWDGPSILCLGLIFALVAMCLMQARVKGSVVAPVVWKRSDLRRVVIPEMSVVRFHGVRALGSESTLLSRGPSSSVDVPFSLHAMRCLSLPPLDSLALVHVSRKPQTVWTKLCWLLSGRSRQEASGPTSLPPHHASPLFTVRLMLHSRSPTNRSKSKHCSCELLRTRLDKTTVNSRPRA